MNKRRVEDAIGQILCHDLTRIVKDEMKGAQFKKGHVITEDDIPMLLSMGKEHVYVWEVKPGMVHENDAALRLSAICKNTSMKATEVSEGKIELKSEIKGLFKVNVDKLDRINAIDELMIATRHSNSVVKPGDKLAGMRIIPLIIADEKLKHAEDIAGSEPILEVLPYKLKRAAIVTTGSEVAKGLIKDTFTPVIIEKLAAYDVSVTHHCIVSDDPESVQEAITAMRAKDVDLILCTGGMSVDPDDNTPGAIKRSGAKIVTYGAPVLPGAMFLLGYFADKMPIMGLPGCVMYAKATIFDLVLPRILAGELLTKQDFVHLGNGGLCLNCPVCHFPICPFGKGI